MQQLPTQHPGVLGSLCPGQKKLEGKIFYLDRVKKGPTALLLETISLLGGAVESFLHRDVSFVVTGSQEFLKDPKFSDTNTMTKVSSEEAQYPIKRESVLSNDKRRLGTPRSTACCSRGKALLEKAIRNNEQLQKGSVLANARSWGVKILYVDDVLSYLKQLTRESFSTMNQRPERTHAKQQAPRVKAAALRSPYLKIEDLSRKYRPLHMQSVTFPSLWYSGRFSPFESPPPQFDRQTEQEQNKTRQKKRVETSIQDKSTMLQTPSPWKPRKKDLSFCECCHQAFANLEEHLQSDQHRSFVLDLSNYSAVDGCIAQMLPGFNPDPQSEETMNQRRTPSPIQDVFELEPLTDAETEHTVQVLQRHGSSFSAHVSSLTTGCPVRLIPDPDTPPADIQPFTTDTDRHPRPSSPTMPVLHVEGLDSADQRPPGLSPDLYSLPPVLSPQSSYVLEPHSPYSEPPVLSPQWYHTVDEKEDGHTSEENVFQSVVAAPVSTSHPPGGSNHQSSSEITHRSRSLPQPNPKKRCRSADPEHNCNKRRRISGKDGWTEPGRGESAHPEVWSSSDRMQSCSKPSSSCAAGELDLRQTFTTLGQNVTANQMDVLENSRTCVASQPSETNHFDPLEFQDSHQSLSLSTSVCIESALIPNLLSQSSSDSDWDCQLVSRLLPTTVVPLTPGQPSCELDKDLLHRPGPWVRDASYESRLHTVLQPSNQGATLCGEEMEPSAFSRTVVHIVEVQH